MPFAEKKKVGLTEISSTLAYKCELKYYWLSTPLEAGSQRTELMFPCPNGPNWSTCRAQSQDVTGRKPLRISNNSSLSHLLLLSCCPWQEAWVALLESMPQGPETDSSCPHNHCSSTMLCLVQSLYFEKKNEPWDKQLLDGRDGFSALHPAGMEWAAAGREEAMQGKMAHWNPIPTGMVGAAMPSWGLLWNSKPSGGGKEGQLQPPPGVEPMLCA